MGAYVMKTLFQTSCISSGMFITAMAANPLAVDLARDSLGATIRRVRHSGAFADIWRSILLNKSLECYYSVTGNAAH